MSISNDQIYSAILEIKADIGGLKSDSTNNHQYITAVSEKLTRHEGNIENAHGSSSRLWGQIAAWAAVGVAGLEVIFSWKGRHGQ